MPMPSGLELDPNPGIDDHLLSLFCCLVASLVAEVSRVVVAVVAVVAVVVWLMVDDPVVLGEL